MKNQVYVIKIGEMFFKDFGEDGNEPTFILPNSPGYEMAVRKYNKDALDDAIDVANIISGKIEIMDDDGCYQTEQPQTMTLVEFIEKRSFHKRMTQDDIGNIIGNRKYSNEQKLERIKKYLEIEEENNHE
ncbi:MAG: hypothetical protein LKI73_11490 [Carnobacterium maltaromaticum]|jgi:hypothetical protein|nr:hypothetical protein [Carnobacterium maltaromaticum]MCI1819852.1 hypothetical protein [Carnobacterium maltaromaticum]